METQSSKQGSILVIDDEAAIREACRRTLGEAGYYVETASDGNEAFRHLDHQEFDFVLTDMRMPGTVTGLDLVEAIKQKTPLTDIVVMTGYPTLETAIPALKNGAYDYLYKPFHQDFLLSVVRRCFEKRQLSGELSREKSLRKELEAAYTELQKVEKLKEAFISRLSHELRTPFVSVFFALDAFESAAQSGSSLELLRSGISKVWDIVQNLLMFADLKRSDIGLRSAAMDVPSMLQTLITSSRPEWERKNVCIDVQCEGEIGPLVGDSQLLQTALKQLLLNAIAFNKKGGQVHIGLKEQDRHLHIAFTDTGAGIPADKLSVIFDSFYQVADYLTREVGGLGLGLAIVRQIIEAHQGAITVTSRPGEGSVFEVALPCATKEVRCV